MTTLIRYGYFDMVINEKYKMKAVIVFKTSFNILHDAYLCNFVIIPHPYIPYHIV